MRLSPLIRASGLVLCLLSIGCVHTANVQQRVTGAQPLADLPLTTTEQAQFVAMQFTASNGITLPYRLLSPAHIAPKKRYPLVLQLHGTGEIGSDNQAQLDRFAKTWGQTAIRQRYPAFIVLPQFPIRSANYTGDADTRTPHASAALHAALELVKTLSSQYPVDTSRRYAIGFSMGASSTLLAVTLEPQLFAAIMPIAGVTPPISALEAFHSLPVLLLHGREDTVNTPMFSQRFFTAMQASGNRHVWLREYDDLGHAYPDDLFPGHWWRRWLFQQKRTPHNEH